MKSLKLLIIVVFVICLLNVSYVTHPYLYVAIIMSLIIYLVHNVDNHPQIEHLQVSSEAIQNVGSIYNDERLTVKDCHITGNITVDGNINFLPKGSIISWGGTDIPKGWQLCNGKNDTPDLRGRFILGSGQGSDLTKRTVGDIGGEETHVLSISEIPSHAHGISKLFEHHRSSKGTDASDKTIKSSCGDSPTDCTSWHPSTDGTGGTGKHNNMPPFYVLAYIMKM